MIIIITNLRYYVSLIGGLIYLTFMQKGEAMSSVEVLLLNGILYTVALLYFCIIHKFSIGVLIWSLYTISAWSSFLFIQQPLYPSSVHASEQTLFPSVYLFVILLLATTPLMKLSKINSIEFINKRLFNYIMIACTLVQIIFIVADTPSMIMVITSGSAKLNSLRDTMYSGDDAISLLTQIAWLNKIVLLFSGMRILATGLSVMAFIAYKRNRKLVILFALTALLNNIRLIIVEVGRGEMVFIFLIYASTIYLMRDWLSVKAKKIILIYALPIVGVGAVFFWVVTVSRFGDQAMFFMYKYLGEPMNNFNGLLFYNVKGITGGRAYFSQIYHYILGEEAITNAIDKWYLIMKMTGVRGSIFYTWVGGLILEFGKTAPFFVALILNKSISRVVSLEKHYTGDLIVLVFLINFFIRGIFIFPTQNFEGMLMILYSFVLYLMFRIRLDDKGRLVFILPKKVKRRRVYFV